MGDASNIDIGWRSALMLAAAIPVYIAVLFLVFRNIERRASVFLAAFLFTGAFALTPQIIGYAGAYSVWPELTYFPFYNELWLGPLFYLHAYCLMRGGPLGWRKWLLLPGAIQTCYYIWAFTMLGDYKSKWAYDGAVHVPYLVPVESVIGITLAIVAIAGVARMIFSYRSFLENTQSAARDFDPRWIIRMAVISLLAAALFIGLEITAAAGLPLSYNNAYPFQFAIMVILAIVAIDALSSIRERFPKIAEAEGAKPAVAERDWKTEGAELQSRLTQEQWFLEPRLTIGQVARRMGSNETYISRALNQGLGESFNMFVNRLRIEYAQKLIINGKKGVLQIAFDSGFNSKATFNRVFKDISGETPSEYRRLTERQ